MIFLYVLPLAIAISLVYAGTRHESWSHILPHAARLCLTIMALLFVTTLVLLAINTQV
jgi:hypothetical protein